MNRHGAVHPEKLAASVRRDLRAGLDAPEVAPYRNHKDKIHFCKGRINQPHDVVVIAGEEHHCSWEYVEHEGKVVWEKTCPGPCESTDTAVMCTRCGLNGEQLPLEALENVDPGHEERQLLREEHCMHGHQYEWMAPSIIEARGLPVLNLPEAGWGLDPEFEYHVCVRCGELSHHHHARLHRERRRQEAVAS